MDACRTLGGMAEDKGATGRQLTGSRVEQAPLLLLFSSSEHRRISRCVYSEPSILPQSLKLKKKKKGKTQPFPAKCLVWGGVGASSKSAPSGLRSAGAPGLGRRRGAACAGGI